MGLFDDALKADESLFKDEIALDVDFVPPKISFRENENQYIAECIKPLFNKRTGKNLFVTGSPGIGKTLAARNVLNELEKETSDIIPLYVNCWKKDSAYKIVLDICDQLNYKFTMNKTTEQLMKIVSEILNKKSCVIVLDEVDKLSSDAMGILYSFAEDIFRKTVILITNEKDFLSKLDKRIFSRLVPENLDFRGYNFDETLGILKERVDYAFVKDVFDLDSLRKISEKTFELGDIRTGLYLLRESGNVAERKLKKKIEEEDVLSAIGKLSEFKVRSSLGEELDKLLELVKNNSGKNTKEIHGLFGEDVSYRTFMRKLKDLEEGNLIRIEEENLGEGKKSIVYFGK